MKLTNVRSNFDTIIHYFDQNHHFFTRVEVYFNHQRQEIRAILLFPFQKKGQYFLDKIEVFYNNQWVQKRGNPNLYGMALANQRAVINLGEVIYKTEKQAKEHLDASYHQFVQTLANRIKIELCSSYAISCEVADDYMSILTIFMINEEEFEGIIETNFHFATNMDEDELLEKLINNYKTQILTNIEKIEIVQKEKRVKQKTYLTTIPTTNPVLKEDQIDGLIKISVQGFCTNCQLDVFQPIKTNVRINEDKLDQHQFDLFISVLGDYFVCEHCYNVVDKENIIVKNEITGKMINQKPLGELDFLGYHNDQIAHKEIVLAAIEHKNYFRDHQESFWNAFSYIASQQWETFIAELTVKELKFILPHYISDIPNNATHEELLLMLKELNLSDHQKNVFWRKVNESLIDYYLNITVFGWDVAKDREIIGQHRAIFIFKYLPIPEELRFIHNRRINSLVMQSKQLVSDYRKEIDQQKQQIQLLQQENGRLSQKLGEAYHKTITLEQASHRLTTDRNKSDIIKIKQLKGLIEDLKAEITQLTSQLEPNKVESRGVPALTEKALKFAESYTEKPLSGKNIFIIGGYRSKEVASDLNYIVLTHDARNLDPIFYQYLNQADILIVLTRYISHQAMWEVKEFAILEQKPIFYSTFTNIPTILNKVAKEMTKGKDN
ncbi:hypothetical protein R4Z10_11565 [Niallia sp. XMNu-256]|uniref:hypothetical protein n=1 Tax=Niallia sp. XMNu-256 TaxID=3082444 RepID=UPI0030D39278